MNDITPPCAGKTAIVADDDNLLRPLMADALAELGFQVEQFSQADEALMRIMRCSQGIALVITDKKMPGQFDGGELAHMLHSRYPTMPVVLSSGWGLDPCDYPGIKLLPKPWSLSALQHMAMTLTSAL